MSANTAKKEKIEKSDLCDGVENKYPVKKNRVKDENKIMQIV